MPRSALASTGLTGGGRLVEAHDRPGVANEVVVVEVAPSSASYSWSHAVGALVAGEPLHGVAGRLVDARRRSAAGSARRRQHTEGEHADDERRRRDRHPPPCFAFGEHRRAVRYPALTAC